MQLKQKLDERRCGGGQCDSSDSEDETNTGPTPDGKWQNGGCEGEKLATF